MKIYLCPLKLARKLKQVMADVWKISQMQATGWVSSWIRDVPSQSAIGHSLDRLGSNLTFYTFTVRANMGLLGASIQGIWAAYRGEVVQAYFS